MEILKTILPTRITAAFFCSFRRCFILISNELENYGIGSKNACVIIASDAYNSDIIRAVKHKTKRQE